MDNTTLHQLKSIELHILREFVRVCDNLNLRYFALGGTLLGAVRHHGFIPWDDDIDVGMLRSDYKIFIEKAQALLPEYYFVQNIYSEPTCPYGFTKIRDSRTAFIESSVKNIKMNHGVFIDVFPLDYYPEKIAAQKVLDLKKRIFMIRLRKEYTLPAQNQHGKLAEVGLNFAGDMLSLIYPTRKGVIEKQEKLYSKAPSSRLITNMYGAWGRRETMPADIFEKTIELDFEDIKISAPSKYDAYLTHVYGDYMVPPPEKKQTAHHYFEALDLNCLYTNYIK